MTIAVKLNMNLSIIMKIRCEIYNCDIVVQWNDIEHHGDYSTEDNTHFITINENLSVMQQIHAIAHECIHCVMSILESRGVIYHYHNDEHFAYYFDWLFRMILDKGGFR